MIMTGVGSKVKLTYSKECLMSYVMNDDLDFFRLRGYWVIRKIPNTKDQFYVACGNPPANVLEIYGIQKTI